jgi:hypothetical protein
MLIVKPSDDERNLRPRLLGEIASLAVASRVLVETLGSRESIHSEVRLMVCFGTKSPGLPYALSHDPRKL